MSPDTKSVFEQKEFEAANLKAGVDKMKSPIRDFQFFLQLTL